MNELKGHIINKVVLNKEDQVLSLTVDGNKTYLIKVYADCCSTGKFLNEPLLGLPSEVVDIKEESVSIDIGGDVYQVYTETLIDKDGNKIVIAYDNLSNGYYGSSLEGYYKEDK